MPHIGFDPQSTGPRPPGRLLAVLVALLVGGGAGAAAGYWFGRREAARNMAATPQAAVAAPVAAAPSPTPGPVPAPAAGVAPGEAAPAPGAPTPGAPSAAVLAPAVPAPAPPVAPVAAPAATRRISATVSGPLEETIATALGPGSGTLAAELTQVANRLLVWSIQIAKDGRRGDRIEILFSPAPPGGSGTGGSQEPVVEALRYTSQKLGSTIAAYRFQPPGARYARYYREDGSEVELRLVEGPIRDYEQITSLVKDGRRHKGVDLRAPVGTPVYAPFDGTIVRRNWNFKGNGNSLDLVDANGRHAIFLHLDVVPKEMAKGRRVRKGEQVAQSGNSGHSFAPHLHYQLEGPDGRVLDPFAVHATRRLSLAGPDLSAFEAARARLDAALAAGN
jgi:murein DD-endopeptidase MepM/ murein hydrolase activator NlpD